MTEPAHFELGPSAGDRWINCGGSVLACRGKPNEETIYSAKGTFGHDIAKECRQKDVKAITFIGRKGKIGKFEFEVDATFAEAIQEFIDYVNGIPGDDYNEQRVRYDEFVKGGFGTMDAAKARMIRAHIIDLKMGEGVQVFAEMNPQLMLYALAFYLTYGWMYAIEDFVLTVFQPLLQHVDSWVISVADLLKWGEEVVRPKAIAALAPGAPFQAGEWCRFCPIRRTCMHRAKSVFAAVAGEMDDLDDAMDAPPRSQFEITPEQAVKALRMQKVATAWFSDLAAHARSELARSGEFAGMKFVEGRSTRQFALPEKQVVEQIMDSGADVQRSQLYTKPELISMPAVEKIVGKALFAPAKENKKTGEIIPAGPLHKLIDKPRGAPVLAFPEDPRPSIKVDANTELSEVSTPDFEL